MIVFNLANKLQKKYIFYLQNGISHLHEFPQPSQHRDICPSIDGFSQRASHLSPWQRLIVVFGNGSFPKVCENEAEKTFRKKKM